jgi:steroid 5-alpha reductase family enzyme
MTFFNWVLDPASIWFASVPAVLILLYAAGLAISSVGFYRLVWFISIGYGFSIAGMAIVSFLFYLDRIAVLSCLHAVLLSAYGLRLGIYLWVRENQATYKKAMAQAGGPYPERNLLLKFVIWLSVAALYAVMTSPLVFHLQASAGSEVPGIGIPGLVIGFGGLLLEATADFQKSSFKRRNPSRFCDIGLYRIVRSPNFFGEMLVWIGGFIAGSPFYGADPWRWILAASGLVVIVLIMLGSAKRLEESQEERYGRDKKFAAYCQRTPILVPLLPVYSLKKLRIYLG